MKGVYFHCFCQGLSPFFLRFLWGQKGSGQCRKLSQAKDQDINDSGKSVPQAEDGYIMMDAGSIVLSYPNLQ